MEDDIKKDIKKMEDDLKKNKKIKTNSKKNLFLIPLKFRDKPFLGLAQLSKIFLCGKFNLIYDGFYYCQITVIHNFTR